MVEGKIGGKTCYYPLEIGRGNLAADVPGPLAGHTYRFDLVLTRRGADTPDGALEPGTLQTGLEVVPWVEMEETVIPF